MAIDAVKIPQNVYIEDRIIGSVSLRQIMLILAGAGVSYAIWSLLKVAGQMNIVLQILAWSPTAVMVVFAFVKINGISIFRMSLLYIEGLDKPRVRRWSPRKGISINIKLKPPKKKQNKGYQEEQRQSSIEQLSQVLDAGYDDIVEEGEEAEGDFAKRETSESSAAVAAPRKPVDPLRIKAESKTGTLVDGITSEQSESLPEQQSPKNMRDIHPPVTNGQ